MNVWSEREYGGSAEGEEEPGMFGDGPLSGAMRHLSPGGGKEGSRAAEGGRKPAPKVISTKKGTITQGQKTAIWTMVRKNGLDEDTFRDWLRREFKTASTKELSMSEAAEVIHHLKVFLGEEYEPHFAGMTWGITGPQMRNIQRLAGDLGWDDPKRLAGMVKKMFPPKSRLELLNKREATSLIIALEKMGKAMDNGQLTVDNEEG